MTNPNELTDGQLANRIVNDLCRLATRLDPELSEICLDTAMTHDAATNGDTPTKVLVAELHALMAESVYDSCLPIAEKLREDHTFGAVVELLSDVVGGALSSSPTLEYVRRAGARIDVQDDAELSALIAHETELAGASS